MSAPCCFEEICEERLRRSRDERALGAVVVASPSRGSDLFFLTFIYTSCLFGNDAGAHADFFRLRARVAARSAPCLHCGHQVQEWRRCLGRHRQPHYRCRIVLHPHRFIPSLHPHRCIASSRHCECQGRIVWQCNRSSLLTMMGLMQHGFRHRLHRQRPRPRHHHWPSQPLHRAHGQIHSRSRSTGIARSSSTGATRRRARPPHPSVAAICAECARPCTNTARAPARPRPQPT